VDPKPSRTRPSTPPSDDASADLGAGLYQRRLKPGEKNGGGKLGQLAGTVIHTDGRHDGERALSLSPLLGEASVDF